MVSVGILGGGISGLSTAYYLLRQRKPAELIMLLEATDRLGGWVQSKRYPDGAVYELGPRSVRPIGLNGINTLAMVDELGLESQVVAILFGHPVTKNRLLMVDDKLHTLPSDMTALFKKVPPFNRPTLAYVMRDLFRRRRIMNDDSMYGFVERRFGKEIAELVIDPLCRGVFAGDARKLSVHALLKTPFEAEQKHGSVVLGLIKGLRAKDNKIIVPDSLLGKMAQTDRWSMWNLRNGLETLVEVLVQRLEERGVEIKRNAGCKRLELNRKTGVHIETADGTMVDCKHVFAALPARQLASALRQTDSYLADELKNIPTVSVAIVTLEFEGSREELLDKQAFGFLIPSSQRPEILGVTYDSCCFPEMDSTEAPRSRFTVMMGGSWFEDHFGDPDTVDHDVLLNEALDVVRRYLRIEAKPIRYLVNVLKNCIPQYTVGSAERLKRMQAHIVNSALPISLVGNSYHGVGINDCIASAKLNVDEFLKHTVSGND